MIYFYKYRTQQLAGERGKQEMQNKETTLWMEI